LEHRSPTPPLFPYTTLFRSSVTSGSCETASRTEVSHPPQLIPWTTNSLVCIPVLLFRHACLDTLYPYRVYFNGWFPWHPAIPGRSEEHTSELQSRFDLVCRL